MSGDPHDRSCGGCSLGATGGDCTTCTCGPAAKRTVTMRAPLPARSGAHDAGPPRRTTRRRRLRARRSCSADPQAQRCRSGGPAVLEGWPGSTCLLGRSIGSFVVSCRLSPRDDSARCPPDDPGLCCCVDDNTRGELEPKAQCHRYGRARRTHQGQTRDDGRESMLSVVDLASVRCRRGCAAAVIVCLAVRRVDRSIAASASGDPCQLELGTTPDQSVTLRWRAD